MNTRKDEAALYELSTVRVFNAPRALVWKAWTDAEHAKCWAGPRGFTAAQLNHDIRPGGKWRACLHHDSEPGTDQLALDLWQTGVYLEVEEPERLVFTFRWDNRGRRRTPETMVTLIFEEQDGKTTMHFHQAFFSTAEDRNDHNRGWNSSFDRLVEHLQEIQCEIHEVIRV